MRPESAGSRRGNLQVDSHLHETQAKIRREICDGTIRVVPAPCGKLRIIPALGTSQREDPEPFHGDGHGSDDHNRKVPALRIERITR